KETILSGEAKALVDKALGRMQDPSVLEGVQREKVWVATGCDKCNGSGYKGRIGIYEAIITDETLEKAVHDNPSERDIKRATESQGIPDMQQDGIIKALKGITSLDELDRVVDLDEGI